MKRVLSEKKQERIKRRLIKGGVKAARRQELDATDLAQLKRVRVQIMSPVLRITLAVIGLGLWVIPFTGWLSFGWMLLFFPVGMILLLVGANGRKKEIGNTIAEVGGEFAGEVLKEVVVGIFSGL